MAADGETLQSDAEHLTFYTVLHHGLRFGEYLVERVFQIMPIQEVVDTLVLATVVYPEVHDAGVALCLTNRISDVTTTTGMFNPEVADAIVGIGETEIAALGM